MSLLTLCASLLIFSSAFSSKLGKRTNTPQSRLFHSNIFVDNIFFNTNQTEEGDDFLYGHDPKGPARWPELYPQCGGQRQSPINITLSRISIDWPETLYWSRLYSQVPSNITIINDGHTVAFSPSYRTSSLPAISGGPLKSKYYLQEIHFHWGTVNRRGSEHTINGNRFPMEIHAVHVKENLTAEEARASPDGIAVIGCFVEIVKKSHAALDKILKSFEFLRNNPGVETVIKNKFPMNELVESFTKKYITYEGSLTTPPCSESVVWILAPKSVGISNKQLEIFRSLYSASNALKDNYRPLQALNGRTVYFVI